MNTLYLSKATALTTVMVFALGASPALANGMANHAGHSSNYNNTDNQASSFDRYDRDNNDRFNNNEFATYTYYTIDYNNDNMISEDEWDTYTSVWYDPLSVEYDTSYDFAYYDSDNDGYLEANEYVAAYDTDLYSAWDMDNDGYIEVAEYDDMVTTYYDYDSNEVYVW